MEVTTVKTSKRTLLSNICKLPIKLGGLALVVTGVAVVGVVGIIAGTLQTGETTTISKHE